MDGDRPRGRFQFHLSTALLLAVVTGAGLGLVIWGIRGQTPLALCALIWLVFAALMVYDELSGPAMTKRPFYHLHFGPWCLMMLGFAVTVYGVVRFQDLKAGDFELTLPCLIGGALVYLSALAERRIRKAEDNKAA